jgi:uncharacterized membrane protein YjgN (DUF898 family)
MTDMTVSQMPLPSLATSIAEAEAAAAAVRFPGVSSKPVKFAEGRPGFIRLVMRGALLELVTFGFYRFWLATDMRRHLWSHTSVDGDAPEYLGTAKELLIGFLFAMAILVPIYAAYFWLGVEAELYQAFASIPLVLFYYIFMHFAVYRARRYRLTRTVWRGVRFSMTGSGLNYAWRVGLWSLLVIVSLGIALPWRQAALERFKMRYTAYGHLRGAFDGTGGQLFKAGWGLWLALWVLALLPIVLGVAGGESAVVLSLVAGLAFAIALPFIYAMYKAIEWRWWVSGIRFGQVQFQSEMQRSELIDLYWKLIGWSALILLGLSIMAGIGWTMSMAMMPGDTTEEQLLALSQQWEALIPAAVVYICVILAFWTVMRIYLIHDIWQRVAASAKVFNLEAAADVATQGQAAGALGEGLAGSLDIVGI